VSSSYPYLYSHIHSHAAISHYTELLPLNTPLCPPLQCCCTRNHQAMFFSPSLFVLPSMLSSTVLCKTSIPMCLLPSIPSSTPKTYLLSFISLVTRSVLDTGSLNALSCNIRLLCMKLITCPNVRKSWGRCLFRPGQMKMKDSA